MRAARHRFTKWLFMGLVLLIASGTAGSRALAQGAGQAEESTSPKLLGPGPTLPPGGRLIRRAWAGSYVIMLKRGVNRRAFLNEHGLKARFRYGVIRGFSVSLDSRTVERLRRDPRVLSVTPDLVVRAFAVRPDIADIPDQTIPAGVPYTGPTPVATGTQPITWGALVKPAGMTIDSSTGVVSWPNPAAGSFLVMITAANSAGMDFELWSLTVTSSVTPPVIEPIADQTIPSGTPYTGPTPVASGTQPITWSLNAGPAGMTIDSSTGVVSWANPTVQSTVVQIRAANSAGADIETWSLTVTSSVTPPVIEPIADQTIPSGTPYTGPTPVASGTQPITWSLNAGPAGMTIDSSTGVVSWTNPTVQTTAVQIHAANSAGADIETWTLTVTAPVPDPQIEAIADQTIPAGAPYTGPTPVASGTQPITWSLSAGPGGMTIDSATGVVSWAAPTAEGSPHTVTIRASNSVGTDDESWALTVTAPAPDPEIEAIADETVEAGAPYTGPTPAASGTQPITWSLVSGPDGMTIDASTGVVNWDAPTAEGSPHAVTIRASNSVGTDDESWNLTVLVPGGGGECPFTGHDTAEVPTGVARIGAQGYGCGINVAVIDTGIDTSHPDLAENYKGGVNFVDEGQPPVDGFGHGTHVAGIIGALSNGAGVVGVASKVNLYAVKVLGDDGTGSLSDVIAGIDWAVANNMDVINLSLGANDSFGVILGGAQYIIDSPMCQAVKNAVEQGVIVIVAAGNEAIDALKYTPANCPHSLTVSAFVDLNGQDGASSGESVVIKDVEEFDETFAQSFSNFGETCWDFDEDGQCQSPVDNPIVNMMAPGVEILSTTPTYSATINGPDFNKALDYDRLNGTSMATPHVAGAAALYLEAHPGASPQDVRNALVQAGECPDGSTPGGAGSAHPHSCGTAWPDDANPSGAGYFEPLLDARGITPLN